MLIAVSVFSIVVSLISIGSACFFLWKNRGR